MVQLRIFSFLFLLISFNAFSQTDEFGKLTQAERNLKIYEKDSSAFAVVLYEKGDNYFKVVDNYIRLIKEYHVKIKILDKRGFDQGTISIPLYKGKTSEEKIEKIKAVTHLNGIKYPVRASEFFKNDLNEHWKEQTFTFPKLEEGCILEYSYQIISPFFFNLTGWDFQSDIPKIHSEYNAQIPGNYVYNRTLIGNLTLDINDASIKKNCFEVPGYSQIADCEVLKYSMKDVPAFKSEKEFMLSERNYKARLDFELAKHNRFDGVIDKYTQSWEDVDKEFKSDKDIGRQLTKNNFFEKHVPEALFLEQDSLTKALNIYKFVRSHYTWNGKYGVYGKARVKDAFEKRSGSASEINMTLINLLNSAGLPTNLMLLSTRESGLPKQTHPVMSDFNYCLAYLKIDDQVFLLDATDKFMPFGKLPFKTLNHYGRVMDFKNDSYWAKILPDSNNVLQIRASVNLDMQNNLLTGIMDKTAHGYFALNTYKKLADTNEPAYLNYMEKDALGDLEITEYELNKDLSTANKIMERIHFQTEGDLNSDMLYLNPFHSAFFKENPFSLAERNYPIDFGYIRTYKYNWALNIPEGYEVVDLPKKNRVTVGESDLILDFTPLKSPTQIGINFTLLVRNSLLSPKDYKAIKDLFGKAIDIQSNSLVVLKKTTISNTGQ
ncbi:DUF3857 domain-containing protein [Cytophaga sp. FL35]|uniref:DUF3857 domain-containing protein n=1 Tax=Cytophaga sp. FL35 TaxID=1904456 RepID=UPI001653DFBA|nr:DUF3857 domain-containing protein [Cytophaga sp. FL35]MBC6998155.1 DUF3857 domain-containing protein [Cytophaga sp. FL35]